MLGVKALFLLSGFLSHTFPTLPTSHFFPGITHILISDSFSHLFLSFLFKKFISQSTHFISASWDCLSMQQNANIVYNVPESASTQRKRHPPRSLAAPGAVSGGKWARLRRSGVSTCQGQLQDEVCLLSWRQSPQGRGPESTQGLSGGTAG